MGSQLSEQRHGQSVVRAEAWAVSCQVYGVRHRAHMHSINTFILYIKKIVHAK